MSLLYNFIRNADGSKVTVLTNSVSKFFINPVDIDVISAENCVVVERGGQPILQLLPETMAINGVPFAGDIEQAKSALADLFTQSTLGGSANGTDAHFTAVDFTGSSIVLPQTPTPASLQVVVGGITLTPTADFSISSNTITLVENRIEPVNVNVFYKYL